MSCKNDGMCRTAAVCFLNGCQAETTTASASDLDKLQRYGIDTRHDWRDIYPAGKLGEYFLVADVEAAFASIRAADGQQGASRAALDEYQPGQWWLERMEALWGHGDVNDDTRRAAKVVCNFAAAVFSRNLPAQGAAQVEAVASLRASYDAAAELAGETIDARNAEIADLRVQLARQSAPEGTPVGTVMVPVEPTDEMVVAFAETWFSKVRPIDDCGMEDCYAAMIAAAPTSASAQPADQN